MSLKKGAVPEGTARLREESREEARHPVAAKPPVE